MSSFNAYREWLGITCGDDRPTFYELLGIDQTVEDSDHIIRSAERAKSSVRSHRPGEYAKDWARVLDEIEEAKRCLTDAQSRAAYDQRLAATDNSIASVPTRPQPSAGKDTSHSAESAAEQVEDFGLDGDVVFEQPESVTPTHNAPRPTATAGDLKPTQALDRPKEPDPMAPLDPMAAQDPMAPLAPINTDDVLFGPADDGSSRIPDMLPPGAGSAEPANAGLASEAGDSWHTTPADAMPGHPHDHSAARSAADPASRASGFDGGNRPPVVGRRPSATARAVARSRRGWLTPVLFVLSGCLLGGAAYVLYQQFGLPSSRAISDAGGAAGRDAPGINGSSVVGTSSVNGTENENVGLATTGQGENSPLDSALQSSFQPVEENRPENMATGGSPGGDLMTSTAMSFGGDSDDNSDEPLMMSDEPDMTPVEPNLSATPPPTASSMPSEPTPEQLAKLDQEFAAAAAALRVKNYSLAENHLASAEEVALREEDLTRVERWMTAVEYTRGFRQAILDGMSKLEATDVLTQNGVSVAVVETAPDYIVLRVRGQNRRYELDALPPGLAVMLAHQSIAPDDPATILSKAMYIAFDPKADAEAFAKARDWIAEAARNLPAAKGMEAILESAATKLTPASDAGSTSGVADMTPAQLKKLSNQLKSARQAVENGDADRAEKLLAEAETEAKGEPYKQLVWRLKTMASQATTFRQAITEGLAALEPGDLIQVGSSTELEVVRTTDKAVIVKVPGLPASKVYQHDDLPLGLAMALGLRVLPEDDAKTKALQASYVVATADGKASALEKAREWYGAAAFADPQMAGLSEVIVDDYEFSD